MDRIAPDMAEAYVILALVEHESVHVLRINVVRLAQGPFLSHCQKMTTAVTGEGGQAPYSKRCLSSP